MHSVNLASAITVMLPSSTSSSSCFWELLGCAARNRVIFLHQCSQHVLGLLQLLRALDGIRLVFGPPLGHLAVGLGQCPLQLGLALLLLLILFPQQVTVVAGGLQGVGQGILGLRED